jgi:hypothetical protein
MHSRETQDWLRREARRLRFRRLRIGGLLALLLAAGMWGILNYRADNFTFAWDRPFEVLVVAVVDPATSTRGESLDALFHRFLHGADAIDGNLSGIEKWIREERDRFAPGDGAALELSAAGPFRAETPPPLPPSGDASFLERWRGTSRFLGYFEDLAEREGCHRGSHDGVIFVYFYAEDRSGVYARQHSVASRRSRMGVIFSPLGREHLPRCAALVAHELCHTLGATDKYEGERSIFPDGFAEPGSEPLYPQEHAEIMALGIPIAPGREERVDWLSRCVVGRKTAEEIGWIRAGED